MNPKFFVLVPFMPFEGHAVSLREIYEAAWKRAGAPVGVVNAHKGDNGDGHAAADEGVGSRI